MPDETNLKKKYPMFDIGPHTYGLLTVMQWSGSLIRIGDYCSFAAGAVALLGGEHPTDTVSTFPLNMFWGDRVERALRADVEIGSDVWVGATSVILGGSTIGHGAVIAAGSVVSGTVAPYAVVGGNPLRFMRWRFPEHIRNALLNIAWWNWPAERVKHAMPWLQSTDVEEFLLRASRGDL